MRVPGIHPDPLRGKRIRKLREQRGLSREELAKRGGFSERRLYDWERGEVIHRPNLHILAAELTTTAEHLLTGDEPAEDPEEQRLDELGVRLSRLEVDLHDQLAAVDARLGALARAVEELALAAPLPGVEDRPPPAADAPPRSGGDANG